MIIFNWKLDHVRENWREIPVTSHRAGKYRGMKKLINAVYSRFLIISNSLARIFFLKSHYPHVLERTHKKNAEDKFLINIQQKLFHIFHEKNHLKFLNTRQNPHKICQEKVPRRSRFESWKWNYKIPENAQTSLQLCFRLSYFLFFHWSKKMLKKSCINMRRKNPLHLCGANDAGTVCVYFHDYPPWNMHCKFRVLN